MKQYLIILSIILTIQIPGWYFIRGRESGGIDDFGNEGWIMIYDWGATFFSFPFYYFLKDTIDNYGIALIIFGLIWF